MISEHEVYRSAGTLIQRFGEGAPDQAGQYADRQLAAGNMDGYKTWQQILRAIDEVMRPEPWPGERIH